MRLLTYLQQNYQLSRRKITALIDDEAIFLNKKLVEAYKIELKDWDNIEIKSLSSSWKDKVKTDIKIKVALQDIESKIVLFNKPVGYVVSKADPHNKTIYTILPEKYKNYYYLGRLDKDSHGLLLLTNDPALVHERSHPSKWIEKEYLVQLNKELQERDIEDCLQGIEDEWEFLRAINIEKWKKIETTKKAREERTREEHNYTYRVTLMEWKKRQIRRMFMWLWYRVRDLQRVREGKYTLGNLKLEEVREIKDA